ncbi:MAG: DUF5659 domain-containing protein [Nitrospirota bacterium]
MTKTEQKTFTTLDIGLASFLELHNLPVKLEVNNGKVIFTFSVNEDLYKLIMDYNSNVSVRVLDFVTTLKKLRGQLLTLRGQR